MRTMSMLTLFLVGPIAMMAQDAAPSWLESTLYGSGKINAVVAVVGIIIIGIGLWLWAQDRRLKRLEDQVKK